MAEQYGFLHDANRCVQCHTCEAACKGTNGLEPGINWRRVTETWSGSFPDVARAFFSGACMHCAQPACIPACPTGAIAKRAEDGIVVVDRDKCNGCRDCLEACPFDVPRFGADGIMQKCDFCLATGMEPACAASCPTEALRCGTMTELETFAAGKSAEKMAGATGPSMLLLK